MKELHKNENVKDDYPIVQVQLKRYNDDALALVWQVYAYDAEQEKDGNEWSKERETFELAVVSLVEKFKEGRKPKSKFVD